MAELYVCPKLSLFDKYLILTGNSAGMYQAIFFQPDISRLRQGRRFIAAGLQPGNLKAFHGVMYKHVVLFLNRALTSPTNVLGIIPSYVSQPLDLALASAKVYLRLPTGVTLEISYGYHTTSEDDQFVQRARTAVKYFGRATSFSLTDGFLVNWIPFRT